MSAPGFSLLSSERPFPGLRPFASEDHEYFFGRQDQIFALYRLIDRARFVAVVGSSGSGKSSLVKAGLLPLLDRENKAGRPRAWFCAEARPGDSPLDNLAAAIAGLREDEDVAVASVRRERVGYQLRYASIEHALAETVNLGSGKLLILVDQFEELFRFAGQKRELFDEVSARSDAVRFVQLLIDTSRASARNITVVLTMRSDFIGECARFQGLPEVVSANQYLVPSLTRDQREEVIREPLTKAGATIEAMLVERLLNDSGSDLDQLPVLQHCLLRIWQQAGTAVPAGAARELTNADYDEIGGMKDAMSKHADKVCDDVSAPEADIERVFRSLSEMRSDSRAVRRALPFEKLLAEFGDSATGLRDILDAFRDDNCSFLTPSRSGVAYIQSADTIDIGHEALLRRWTKLDGEPGATGDPNDKRKIGWLREERRDARQYDALVTIVANDTHGDATLPAGQIDGYESWWSKLRPNAAWAERYGGGFESIDNLLKRSRAAADRTRELERRRERGRFVMAALAVLAVFAVVEAVSWSRSQVVRQQELETLALRSANDFVDQIHTSLTQGTIQVAGAKELLKTTEKIVDKVQKVSDSVEVKLLRIKLMLGEYDVYYIVGDLARARPLALLADQNARQLADQYPENAAYKDLIYQARFRLGDTAAGFHNYAAALQYFRGAIALVEARPPSTLRENTRAFIYGKIGEMQQLSDDLPDSIKTFQTTLDIMSALAIKEPNDIELKRLTATILDKKALALFYEKPPDYMDSVESLDKAVLIQLNLVKANPDNIMKSNLGTSYFRRGNSLAGLHRFPAAFKDFGDAIAIHFELAHNDPGNPIWQRYLAQDHMYYGQAFEAAGNPKGARIEYDLEFVVRLNMLAKEPDSRIYKRDLVQALTRSLHASQALAAAAPPDAAQPPEGSEKSPTLAGTALVAPPAPSAAAAGNGAAPHPPPPVAEPAPTLQLKSK